MAVIIHGFFTLIISLLYKTKINNLLESIDSVEDMLYICSRDYLNLIAEVFRRKGNVVKITDKCGEEGNGLLLNDIQYVEIWKHGLNQADVEVAMKLAKCMRSNSIYRGILVTLGEIKQSTRLFCHKNVIECINGEQLLAMCKDVQRRKDAIQTS